MSKYDELLARLDDVGPEEILKDISAHYRLVDDAAAAIRELRAAALADGGAREPVATLYDDGCFTSGWHMDVYAAPIAPERTVAGPSPPESYYVNHAVRMLKWGRTGKSEQDRDCAQAGDIINSLVRQLAIQKDLDMFAPASPLLPGLERAIHVVELTAWEHDVPPFDQHLLVDAIHAEISRLKRRERT